MKARKNHRTWHICSVPSSRSAKFSLFKNCDVYSAKFLCDVLNFILAMLSLSAESAAVTTHCEKLFIRILRGLNFESKAGIANSAVNEINTLQLMSSVLVGLELVVESDANKKKT